VSRRCFVGIDPSLTGTGIASVVDGRVRYVDRIEPASKGVQRLLYLKQSVQDRIAKLQPAAVCIEGYSFASKFSRAHALGEWGGVLRVALAEMGIPTFDLPPQSLKKFATGRGDTKGKAPMADALWQRLGSTMSLGDDEVDAVWLAFALYDQDQYAGGHDLPKHALEALDKLDTVFTPRLRRRA
jgi:crossover junction endodeoxyribonuclease RuvC